MVGAVVLAAVATVATVIATNRSELQRLEAIDARLGVLETHVGQIQLDIVGMQHDVADVKLWKEKREDLAENLSNPYVKTRPGLKQRKAPTP
jgi:hypothetical protein